MRRALVLLGWLALASAAFGQTTTVILVRHAEKAGTTGDVPLTEGGVERARELTRVLAGAGIDTIYVTQWVRTLQTVEALAAALKLQPVKFETGANYARGIAADIRAKHGGETVLVAGHSNTTGDVMRALGIENPPKIEDWEHDGLYIVTLSGEKEARLTVIRYGAVSRPTS